MFWFTIQRGESVYETFYQVPSEKEKWQAAIFVGLKNHNFKTKAPWGHALADYKHKPYAVKT